MDAEIRDGGKGLLRRRARPRSASRSSCLAVLLAVSLLGAAAGCGKSTVTLSNTMAPAGHQNGLLISDGFTSIWQTSYVSAGDTIQTGPNNGIGELLAFSDQRPPTVQAVTWPGPDKLVAMAMLNTIRLPVTIWIVQGPFNTQRTKQLTDTLTTTNIWLDERAGLAFGDVRIVDSTADPQRTNYLAFDCGERSGIQTDIGRDAGRINVYIVNTVAVGSNFATTNGNACEIGGNFVALGQNSGTELLAHEIGHNFALTHVDDLTTDFNQTNVMHPSSNTRDTLTEGQLFRAHVTPGSAINGTYGARGTQLQRTCPRDTQDKLCPPIRKRIWADGTFPAN